MGKVNDDLSMQTDLARRFERSMEIVRMYRDGVPIIEICEVFECSRGTVLRMARAAGLPRRPKNKFPEKTKTDAIEMLKQGMLQEDIAKELGTSVAWVSILGRKMGLNRYPNRRERWTKRHTVKSDESPIE